MFTGLIEEIGIVRNIETSGSGMRLTVSAKKITDDVKTGDSVSIDGACHTVVKFTKDSFTVFASKVTCETTTTGSFTAGRRVNLERAMPADGRFGGHFVQGHVDGKGKIKSIQNNDNGVKIEFTVPKEISRYIVDKGSVAVDGISLTVVSMNNSSFLLNIIPETIKNTTLIGKQQGMEVNIEVDILAKYVENMLQNKDIDRKQKDDNLIRALSEGGFI